jgi:hypothetical protein
VIRACDFEVMTTNHDLAMQIEDLIRQHIDTLRTTAATAIAHAFAAAPPRESARASAPTKPRRARTQAPRRAPEELVALGERFCALLCQHPGKTMTELAPQVGVAPRVLHVAVARLRRTGRVRAIGQRQQMRYYPMATAPTTAPARSASAVA